MMKKLQELGKALMQPVAILPVAALLMGIGYWIDPTGWGAGSPIAAFFIKAGDSVLGNLGILFAVGVSYGISEDKNGSAALSGLVAFLVVTTLLSADAISQFRGIAVETLPVAQGWGAINNKNVFLGIISGIVSAKTYNKFHKVELPQAFAFFSGRRLAPIMTALFMLIVSFILYFVWPFIYSALVAFGTSIQKLGPAGAGIYGFFNRLLIPTGLHHALNSVFWFDIAGINDIGKFLGGAKSIADGTGIKGVTGMYQAGFFPIMMFGLPGAALAMYKNAKPEKKTITKSLMIAGMVASFTTGVTEPIEFAFMFLAPGLYLLHAVLTGISVAIAASLHWTAGFGFSAGLIDFVLSLRNPLANKPYMLLLLGVVFFFIYYFSFSFAIKTFNIKTPGREDDTEETEVKIEPNNFTKKSEIIIEGLGGIDNISSIDYCATRLRTEIKDAGIVDDSKIKSAGILGLIKPSEKNVQVIIGPKVQFVYDEVKRITGK
ncbi:N-acetylglucosamine-specific PTS transporter subunit IIBC [Peptostreptococcus canis]|uniref:PTS transporter subunit EIIC n=1 Tax=Peptostreptococcus canis TaxID=1159213 RepID=A0ABR6TI84_9FIRM|nr:N-acetylglucosamine-specific PTS transporter subunit IIBC [Peptostreptococcus canis]MBC2575128.1 PTS transporter subunit EIIC [Peptostreptococcus canis]MBP1997698.1 PTS system N-acetylglucosamine-specific IIC component [Peptostreptococcus canis]